MPKACRKLSYKKCPKSRCRKVLSCRKKRKSSKKKSSKKKSSKTRAKLPGLSGLTLHNLQLIVENINKGYPKSNKADAYRKFIRLKWKKCSEAKKKNVAKYILQRKAAKKKSGKTSSKKKKTAKKKKTGTKKKSPKKVSALQKRHRAFMKETLKKLKGTDTPKNNFKTAARLWQEYKKNEGVILPRSVTEGRMGGIHTRF
jgi:hypothetical protein